MGKGDCPLSREVCPARGRMPTAADIRVERNQSDRREKVKGRKETEQVHVGNGAGARGNRSSRNISVYM
jgi:hypothetical protein